MPRYRAHARGPGDSPVPLNGHEDGVQDTGALDVVVQLLAAFLESRNHQTARQGTAPQHMLTVAQTAALLGTSRATIIRKADAGELPCVVVSRGKKQKMRRFPQALIEDLALCAGGPSETDLREFAAAWLGSIGGHPPDNPEG